LIGVAILEGFLRISRAVLLSWRGFKFEYEYAMKALTHLLHADMVSFDSQPKGAYLDKMQALEQVREFFHGQSILMLVDLPFVVVFLWLIWLFAGQMVLIPLTVIGIFLLVSLVSARALRRALEARSENDERRQNFLIESLQGIHALKSMAVESQMQRRYERLQGQSANSVYILARVNSVIQGLGVTFSQAVMVSFLGIGAIFALQGAISIGALAAGTMLAGRVLQPALKAMGLWTHFQSVRLARQKFDELLEMPSEAVEQRAERIELGGAIELVDVHFRHPGDDTELISGASICVEPGSAVGITGNNGVGKSTLLDLIMGFVRPCQGRILLDGRDLEELDRSSVRAQIGLVPQRGVLFGGTLLENMTLFREGDAVDQAIALARKLGLDHTITRLSEGLDTHVGGGMVDALSAGFRQRIIMVRALVGDPKIVLFDDANAAFDSRNDALLVDLLKELKGNRTLLIVSHRPSILRLCDRVLTLEDGHLTTVENDTSKKIPASPSDTRVALRHAS
jgi:ATP-binding cassette subfamily C protein LapB